MPPIVRREGDPRSVGTNTPPLAPDAGRLVEMIQLEHTPCSAPRWTVGWDGGGPASPSGTRPKRGTQRASLEVPSPPTSRRCRTSSAATRSPAARSGHAAFALPNYALGRTGYACLRRHRRRPPPAGPVNASASGPECSTGSRRHPERTVAEGLATYRAVVGDRTMHGVASTSGPGAIAATGPRWKQFGMAWPRPPPLRLRDHHPTLTRRSPQ